ncbi:chromate efflux transporter [Bermanella sp. R86510]|uniref:chromate efflux transporter n=1 Tax=unclassified Bermanella TaxID=2627862 RepID=UPI0037CBDA5D
MALKFHSLIIEQLIAMKSALSLFATFFVLGCTSFGGPAAHLGYFHQRFVKEKQWLTEDEYGKLLALSQFLPGPGSSQVGFAIGLNRMGLLGGITAFIAFTLPSFLIMLVLAMGYIQLSGQDWLNSIIHGFKLLAVVVVLDAVLGMGKNFCNTRAKQLIAVATAIAVLLAPVAYIPLICIALAAVVGLSQQAEASNNVEWKVPKSAWVFGAIFVGFLFLPLNPIFSQSYTAGSLVFGGGHVVLPLLQDYFSANVGESAFITGYATAQAIPGPMFTFATFLGALSHESPVLGALLATAGIFLPGFLLLLTFHKLWNQLSHHNRINNMVMAINASVVGLLGATLYHPIFTSSVMEPLDFAWVLAGFALLKFMQLKILWLIAITVVASLVRFSLAP